MCTFFFFLLVPANVFLKVICIAVNFLAHSQQKLEETNFFLFPPYNLLKLLQPAADVWLRERQSANSSRKVRDS